MSKKYLLLLLSIAFFFRVFLSFGSYHPDIGIHMDWGTRFFEYGGKAFYGSDANVWNFAWPNQPPGTVIMLLLIRKIYELLFSIIWFINVAVPAFPSVFVNIAENSLYPALIKFPAIIADFGISYLIYKILLPNSKKIAISGALLFLLNPVIWYNSAIWGQTDSIVNFLILLAVYKYQQKKLLVVFLAIAISLYIKLSMLIFIPLFILLFVRDRIALHKVIIPTSVTLILISLLTTIFSVGNPLVWLWNLYNEKILVEQLHLVSANAFNFWAIITGAIQIPNSGIFLFLNYEAWGWILFFVSFIPVLYLTYKRRKDSSIVYWAFALTAFCSFMFMTNMHERYLYPLFPYLAIIASRNRRELIIYIVISIVNLVNVYNLWWKPTIHALEQAMSAYDDIMFRVLGAISLACVALLYYLFLQKFKTKTS